MIDVGVDPSAVDAEGRTYKDAFDFDANEGSEEGVEELTDEDEATPDAAPSTPAAGPPADAAEWLVRAGLMDCVVPFKRAKVQLHQLSTLSKGDIGRMGVPIGSREKLLKLCAEVDPEGALDLYFRGSSSLFTPIRKPPCLSSKPKRIHVILQEPISYSTLVVPFRSHSITPPSNSLPQIFQNL